MPRHWSIKPPCVAVNMGHPLAQGLTGFWLMHEGAGGSIANLVSPITPGTLGSAVSWGVGAHGPSLSLPSGAGSVVTIPSNSDLRPAALTLLCRLKTTTNGSVGQVYRAVDHATEINNFGFSMATNANAAGDIAFFVKAAATIGPSATRPTDGWYHDYVGTWDGSTARLYIDGLQVATDTSSGAPTYGTGQSLIGMNDTGSSAQTVTGNYEYVLVYNRALIASEVLALTIQKPLSILRPRSVVGISTTSPFFFQRNVLARRSAA